MGKEGTTPEKVFYVCTGSKCKKAGGKEIAKAIKKLLKEGGLKDSVEVIKTDCTDRCKLAPVFSLQPDNTWFVKSSVEHACSVFSKEIKG